jgi:hypothetical protein
MSQRALGAGVVLAWLPAVMFAADPQLDAARQCTQLKDSLQRLVCYDKALMEAAPAASTMSVAPAPAVRAAPAPAPAPAASPAPAVVAAAPAAPAAAPALGDESLKRSQKQRKESDGPTSLEAKVTAAREVRQATYRVTLDNGQVWQQMDMSTLFQVGVGDVVRIEKGALGGFRMARVSNGRSGWVRVNRVE